MSLIADIHRTVADRIAPLDSSINVFAFAPKAFPLPAALVLPDPGTYIAYHRTFGPSGLLEVNLIVRVLVAEKGSAESAAELLAGFLSTGYDEDLSLADAITGSDVTIGSTLADIYCDEAVGWIVGDLGGGDAPSIPVVSADLPTTVRIMRSAT